MVHSCKAMIGPSLLASDMSALADESRLILSQGADYLHLDIMDGHFVPNLTFGAPIIKCLRKQLGPQVFFDCHVMVSNPERWVEDFKNAGANVYTFHLEAIDVNAKDNSCVVRKLITRIKDAGMRCGIAINPGTAVESLLPYADLIDLALIMTVEPGFGGQSFMDSMMEKVRVLRKAHPSLDIEVDGGLGEKTIDFAAEAGANWIVAGSSVFKSTELKKTIKTLRDSVERLGNGKAI